MSLHRAFGPALAILLLTAAAQAQDSDLPKFAGTWTVTAAELAGEPAAELVGATFEFDDKTAKFTQKGADGAAVTDTHPFKADVKTKRLVLYQDVKAEDPEKPVDPKVGMQRGIYKFGTSGLFLCLTPPDAAEFPKEFTSKPEFLMLKLEKAKPGAAPSTAAVPSPPAKK